jgi:Ca2+-binding RTX toxin-like protein
MALLGAALGGHAGAATEPAAEAPRCHGHRATIVGTPGNDVLKGTPRRDVIWAGPGNDVIYGGLGNDLICGGAGDDLIHGGRGNDLVDGGPGTDRVFGDLGDDRVLGGPGNRDEVGGGLGIDTVSGGPGNEDLVHGDYGYDRMDGGPGKGDIASFATAVGGDGRNRGVWASLRAHSARGDGHDRLYRFESLEGSAFPDTLIGDKAANLIDGGPGNDHVFGGGGQDTLNGGQGTDGCKGGPIHISCGPEKPPNASAYVQVDPVLGGGGGLQIVGGNGPDDITVSYDEGSQSFGVTAAKGIAVGYGCVHLPGTVTQVSCPLGGPARWLMTDLGPGNDRLRVEGSLRAVDFVRLAGGRGNDVIHGGPEDDLIESGPGSDRIYGGGGADGLIGGLPGPTFLYGGPGGDLLAAGGGCAGGALVGGPGRDDASFAETQAHPGTLYISLAAGWAWIDAVPGCHKVRLARSDEDIEGSFDNDVLIGDAGANFMLGQPGKDSFYGRGGEDVIVATDGVKDAVIQCGSKGHPSGRALIDSFDPAPLYCKETTHGRPVAGLHKK